jgi:hypothetical protein
MIHLRVTKTDFGDPGVSHPFVFWHEAKEEIANRFIPHIKEMAATDIDRRTVHIHASAKASRLGLLLKDHKGVFSLVEETMGECKAGGPSSKDKVFDVCHMSFFLIDGLLVESDLGNQFCRISSNCCTRRDIVGYNCPCSNNRAITDGHPFENDRSGSDETIFSDDHSFGDSHRIGSPAAVGHSGMKVGIQNHRPTADLSARADIHAHCATN